MSEIKRNLGSADVLRNIEATEPMLLELAAQLLDREKGRWNVLIGDDAGGRLPARFVHDIFKLDGRDMQTFFIAGSKLYREANGAEPYEDYFAYITKKVGEPLRPLVVTESVGSATTVDFIREQLAQYSDHAPEVATIACSEQSISHVEYAGGVGSEALKDVWLGYESPEPMSLGRRALRSAWQQVPAGFQRSVKSRTSMRITPPSANTTVGLEVDTDYPLPVVRRSEQRDGTLSSEAHKLIEKIAHDAYDLYQLDHDRDLAVH